MYIVKSTWHQISLSLFKNMAIHLPLKRFLPAALLCRALVLAGMCPSVGSILALRET